MRMIGLRSTRSLSALGAIVLAAAAAAPARTSAAAAYQIFVSNERAGTVTIIDGGNFKVIDTIPVGKRPRGIHTSPDGKKVYVALSGSPIEGPPQLDAAGNPILKKNQKDDDDEDEAKADKSADGIGVIDVASRKVVGKISAGSDPEEFALSRDGTHFYASNEDTRTASAIDVTSGKVTHIVPVGGEPEGVGVTPDGKEFYVTCETGGEVFAIDTTTYKVVGHFTVPVRPRSIDFLPTGAIGFIPSETYGKLNVIDLAEHKVLKAIDLPAGSRPMRVRVSPEGSKVFVSDGRAGSVSVLDAHSYALLATVKVGTRPW